MSTVKEILKGLLLAAIVSLIDASPGCGEQVVDVSGFVNGDASYARSGIAIEME